MPRKGPAPRREIHPDPIHNSVLVTQFINKVLQRGKRNLAERIVYDALTIVEEKTGAEPVSALKRAVDNVRPDSSITDETAPPLPERHQGFGVESSVSVLGQLGPMQVVSPPAPRFSLHLGYEPFSWASAFAEADLVIGTTELTNPPPKPRS